MKQTFKDILILGDRRNFYTDTALCFQKITDS